MLAAWLIDCYVVRPHRALGVYRRLRQWWRFPGKRRPAANVVTPSMRSLGGQPAYNRTFVEVVYAGPSIADEGGAPGLDVDVKGDIYEGLPLDAAHGLKASLAQMGE